MIIRGFYIIILMLLQTSFAKESLVSANQLLQNNDLKGAINAYESLLQEGYKNAALYENLGTALFRNDQIVEARKAFENARVLAPNNEQIRSKIKLLREQLQFKSEVMPVIFL